MNLEQFYVSNFYRLYNIYTVNLFHFVLNLNLNKLSSNKQTIDANNNKKLNFSMKRVVTIRSKLFVFHSSLSPSFQ
jgi:succinate dehydrogenase/fumarate reductase cytochrome b subunit